MLPRKFYFNDFDHFFEDEGAKMKCDIYQKENTYHVEMDLPGFSKNEIRIECNKGNLVVTAEKEEQEEDTEDKKYIRRERVYGKYSRSFYLGDMNEDAIEAEYTDGTLHIIIPKLKEENNKKQINIR